MWFHLFRIKNYAFEKNVMIQQFHHSIWIGFFSLTESVITLAINSVYTYFYRLILGFRAILGTICNRSWTNNTLATNVAEKKINAPFQRGIWPITYLLRQAIVITVGKLHLISNCMLNLLKKKIEKEINIQFSYYWIDGSVCSEIFITHIDMSNC